MRAQRRRAAYTLLPILRQSRHHLYTPSPQTRNTQIEDVQAQAIEAILGFM